jgi:uncharacterized protein YabN with tetrapyrrole methylase and pyrophosphatase domain
LGFDWRSLDGVRDKMREEWGEVEAAEDDAQRVDELGDLLFAVVNYARWLEVDPESSLRAANRRFRQRFAHMETAAARAGRPLGALSLEELDGLWREAKRQESRS